MRKYWYSNVLCTALYVDVNAVMPGYSVRLDIDDVLYMNCCLHDLSNCTNMSIERTHTHNQTIHSNICYILTIFENSKRDSIHRSSSALLMYHVPFLL